MNVPSVPFLGFAFAVALLVNVSPVARWRRIVLLGANLAFVLSFTHSPKMLLPFAALLAFGFGAVKLLERRKSRVAFWLLAGALLLAFCWLKRYAFLPSGAFLPFVYFTVGLSYVFFRVLHLAIDTFQGTLEEPVDALSYANYTLNFTSLVSGPIQYYGDYRRTESEHPAPLDAGVCWKALERIVLGFFKVEIVSPLLGRVQHLAMAATGSGLGGAARILDVAALLAVFPVFLYANFSGYMDVVIGVGRLLRLELPENFNRPFASTGFIEFWTRWHMTLSNWVKTYVYSPLLIALMRRFPRPALEPYLGVGAYFVTFFLVGMWHGQSPSFIILGALLGAGMSVNKLYQILAVKRLGRGRYRTLCATPWYVVLSRGLTFTWLCLSCLWFWVTWPQVATYAALLGAPALLGGVALTVAGSGVVLSALVQCERLAPRAAGHWNVVASPYLRTVVTTTLVVVTFSVSVLLRAPAPQLVYKGF
jgi:D-alanyl-lipoteichoic acid acyltransferase DltB (MBOAT superfamily)